MDPKAFDDPFAHSHDELKSQKHVAFVDSDRRYVACSDAVCDLLGYTKKEILEKRIEDLSFFRFEVPEIFARYVSMGAMQGRYLLRAKTAYSISIEYRSWKFDDGCLAAVWQPAEQWVQLYHRALTELEPPRLRIACKSALAEIEIQRMTREQAHTASDDFRRQVTEATKTLHSLLKQN